MDNNQQYPQSQAPAPEPSTEPVVPTLNQVSAPVEESSSDVQQPVHNDVPTDISSDIPAAPQESSLFSQIAEKIIEQQEAIIGPIAVEQAKSIRELAINWPQHDVGINGNPQQAIDELVEKYKELFGQIAVQVSREAAAGFLSQLPADQQPKSLVG